MITEYDLRQAAASTWSWSWSVCLPGGRQ